MAYSMSMCNGAKSVYFDVEEMCKCVCVCMHVEDISMRAVYCRV